MVHASPELFESEKIVVRNLTGENETVDCSPMIIIDWSSIVTDLIVCVTYYEERLQHTNRKDRSLKDYDRISNLQFILSVLNSTLTSVIGQFSVDLAF